MSFVKDIKIGKENGLDKIARIIQEEYNYEDGFVNIFFRECLYNGKNLVSQSNTMQIRLQDREEKKEISTTTKTIRGKGKNSKTETVTQTESHVVIPASTDYTDYCEMDDKERDKVIEQKIKERYK